MKKDDVTGWLLDELAAHYAARQGESAPLTDYALASAMGYTRQRISKWRNRERFGKAMVIEACDILWPGDLDQKARVMLRWMAEGEKDADLKPLWEKLSRQVAAVALLVLSAGLFTPAPAQAANIIFDARNIDYAHLRHRLRRRIARARRTLAAILAGPAIILFSGCSTSGQEIAWQTLHAIDVAQTVNGPAGDPCYFEIDPLTSRLIGAEPSKTDALAWGLATAGLHAGVTWLLARQDAPTWLQSGWQALTLTGTTYTVIANHREGIRPWGDNKPVPGCP